MTDKFVLGPVDNFQKWRAVAFTAQGVQHLLCLGSDTDEVKKLYKVSFFEYLLDEEQAAIKRIELQRWKGTTGKYGKWESKGHIPVPKPDPLIVQREIPLLSRPPELEEVTEPVDQKELCLV